MLSSVQTPEKIPVVKIRALRIKYIYEGCAFKFLETVLSVSIVVCAYRAYCFLRICDLITNQRPFMTAVLESEYDVWIT